MMLLRECDIFDTPPNYAIVHQCNCFNTLGDRKAGGFAKLIQERYPQAAEADAQTKKGDLSKLATLSTAKGDDGRLIINAYTQFSYGDEGRFTDYDAVFDALTEVRDRIIKRNTVGCSNPMNLAIPYGYGSVRGGASWRIIHKMIEIIFESVDFKIAICRMPGQPDLP